jgi:hypothetical protein
MVRTSVSAASSFFVMKQWHSSAESILVRCRTAQNTGGCLLELSDVESSMVKRQSIDAGGSFSITE